nr:hypothetical protein Iba_chr11cCG11160 [Ipomoea batatas]
MKCKEDWISNIPRGWGFVEERLDRVVATDTWRALHREAEICNLECLGRMSLSGNEAVPLLGAPSMLRIAVTKLYISTFSKDGTFRPLAKRGPWLMKMDLIENNALSKPCDPPHSFLSVFFCSTLNASSINPMIGAIRELPE